MLGDGSLLHRAVEFLIGVVMPSADAYARRIVPLLFAKELDARTGLMFGGKANPILPTEGMTEAYVAKPIDTSEKLLENALKR